MKRYFFLFFLLVLLAQTSWAQQTVLPDSTQHLIPEAWRTWQPYQPPAVPDSIRWLWTPEGVRRQGTLSPTRWLVTDPLADQYPAWSPYNYVLGNPLLLVDPDGKDVYVSFEDDEARQAFREFLKTEYGQQFIASFAKAGKLVDATDADIVYAEFESNGIYSDHILSLNQINEGP